MKPFFRIFFFLFYDLLFSQQGLYNFQILNVPENAIQAAIGGENYLLLRKNIQYSGVSEAVTNPTMHRQIGFYFGDYVSNLHFFSLKYIHDFYNVGTTSYGLRYFNYGKFQGYDEFDNTTGSFFAHDLLFHAGISRHLPEDSNFRIGIRMNMVYSRYHDVWALATSGNLSAHYHLSPLMDVSVNAVNIGSVLKDYYSGNTPASRLPSDVIFSFGHKLKKAPLRFLWNYHQLLRWNLRYTSPLDTARQTSLIQDETREDTSRFRKFMINVGKTADNFLRHAVLGIEFELSKNFIFYISYNYRRQQEMMLQERRGMNGLNFGFLLNTRHFSFSYAYSQAGFGGRVNQLSLSVPVWFRKRTNAR